MTKIKNAEQTRIDVLPNTTKLTTYYKSKKDYVDNELPEIPTQPRLRKINTGIANAPFKGKLETPDFEKIEKRNDLLYSIKGETTKHLENCNAKIKIGGLREQNFNRIEKQNRANYKIKGDTINNLENKKYYTGNNNILVKKISLNEKENEVK